MSEIITIEGWVTGTLHSPSGHFHPSDAHTDKDDALKFARDMESGVEFSKYGMLVRTEPIQLHLNKEQLLELLEGDL